MRQDVEISKTTLDLYISWHNDPVKFCRDLFGITLEEWQVEALGALAVHDLIAFIASKGVGKSFLEAVAGWWWMVTRKKAQVICTSINADNLKKGLWKEIDGLYQRSPFLQAAFEMNSEQAYAKPDGSEPWARDEWAMSAKGWRNHADAMEQAQALAGIHGPHMLWLGDEAGSYHKAIVASGSAMRSGVGIDGNEAKILLGGNPTDPAGPLGDIHKDRSHWKVININGDPDNPKRCRRISMEWAREEIRKHGREDPYVKVSVFGEFPEVGFSSLLGPAEVDAAFRRFYNPPQYERAQKRMGVDVARFGDDSTVLYIRQGLKAGPFWKLRNLDTQQVADRVALEFKRHNCEIIFVDETGVGGGVVDALRRIMKGIQVIGVNSSGKPVDQEKFYNKRAEMMWTQAEWVRQGGWLPAADTDIKDELLAPTYNFKGGKILIEEKAKIKEQIGHSPDCSDAEALTHAAPDMPSVGGIMGVMMLANLAQQRAKEYHPFEGERRGEFDPNAVGEASAPEPESYPEKL